MQVPGGNFNLQIETARLDNDQSLGNGSELKICLRGEQVAPSLLKLLVNFRSLDKSEQLAFFDVRPNIEIPFPQVAIGTSVNR